MGDTILEDGLPQYRTTWDRNDEVWIKRFNRLKEFVEQEHRWPIMVSDSVEERSNATFRFAHHLRKAELSPFKVALLESIGFPWNNKDSIIKNRS